MRALVCLLLLSGLARAERSVLVVTAAPPLDASRLADTLSTYLDSYAVDVRAVALPAAALATGLRGELLATSDAAAAANAIAGVRIADPLGKEIEIQLVDRLTKK